MSQPTPQHSAGDGVEVTDLQRRVAELEPPTSSLTAALDTTPAPPAKKRWRSLLAAVLIVLAGLLAPVSMLGTWAKTTLIDTDSFVANFSPVIRDSAVQAATSPNRWRPPSSSRSAIDQLVGDAVDALQSAVGDRRAAAAPWGCSGSRR